MAYVKNTWVDQEGQVRYTETQDGDLKIFTPNYEEVTEIGTPVNADNMNHIENGIADNDAAISIIQDDLSNKANVNLSNLTTVGKNKISPIGQPQFTLDFDTLPTNCIWLEGAEVSRTTYANLFAIYGTTYGAGDGSTTFTLPDFRNRTLWGSTYGGYISAGLPNITGSFFGTISSSASGAFYQKSGGQAGGSSASGSAGQVGFNASRDAATARQANGIYRNDCYTVQPPSIKVRVYTRYQ